MFCTLFWSHSLKYRSLEYDWVLAFYSGETNFWSFDLVTRLWMVISQTIKLPCICAFLYLVTKCIRVSSKQWRSGLWDQLWHNTVCDKRASEESQTSPIHLCIPPDGSLEGQRSFKECIFQPYSAFPTECSWKRQTLLLTSEACLEGSWHGWHGISAWNDSVDDFS